MRLTQTEIRAIRQKLVFGDIARIAEMSGMSSSSVKRWLNGETFNPRVANSAEELFSDREEAAKRLRETLKTP